MAYINPEYSGVLGYGELGTFTLGLDLISGSSYFIIPVQVFDNSMNYSGRIDDYEFFSWTHSWYGIDNWEMQINRYKTGVDQMEIGGFIRFIRYGEESIGIIESIEKPLSKDGKGGEQWIITGRGVESIFDHRLCMNLIDSGLGYDSSNNVAETTMRWYVNKNCIDPSDNARVIGGLTLAAVDNGLGDVVNYTARLQTVAQVLEDIAKVSGLSYSLVWSGTGRNFVFTVLEGSDLSANVVLSPNFENVSEFQYQNSNRDSKNLVYVGGSGTGAGRTIYSVYTVSEPISWSRREYYVDGSDCSTNEQLQIRGEEILSQYEDEESLEAVYLPSNSFVFQVDFYLGDIVTVVFPDVATMYSRIIEVTEEYSADTGEKITLGFGKNPPDLIGILKTERKNTGVQARR